MSATTPPRPAASSSEPATLCLPGTCETLEAKAGGKTRRYRIAAYSGGLMNHAQHRHPVVVDVSGVTLAKTTLPILADHDGTLQATVGHTDRITLGNDIVAEGPFSGANAATAEVVEKLDGGLPLQASVGIRYSATDTRDVPPGETVRVNGQSQSGPLFLVSKATLYEISVVPLGADQSTSVALTATAKQKEEKMSTATDPVSIERERIARGKQFLASAKGVAADDVIQDLEAQWADDAITFDHMAETLIASTKAQNKLREYEHAAPKAPPVDSGRRGPGVKSEEVLEAAYHLRCNETEAEGLYSPHVLEAAADLRRHGSLLEMTREQARRDGYTPPANPVEMLSLQAGGHGGYSTVSVPTIISNVANKSVAAQFTESLAIYETLFPPVSVSNFKAATQIRLVDTGELSLVPPQGEVKSNSIDEATYTISADTYAAKTTLSRQMIINDDASVFDSLSTAHGLKGSRKVKNVAMTRWLDNSQFFTSGNKNLATSNVLGHEGLSAAVTKMRTAVDEEGRSLDITPGYLFVPPELEEQALRLTRSDSFQIIDNTTDAQGFEPTGNAFSGIQVVVEPRLSNAGFSGQSSSSWYLIAKESALAPMRLAYLNGMRSPTVELFGYDSDPTTLGMTWRVYFDFGVAFAEPRTAIKATA